MPECQYCGAYADEGRTFCPRCRRRMQPRLAALHGAPIEPAMNLAQIDPPLARGGLVTLNGGDSLHYCQRCCATPAQPGRYTIVESSAVCCSCDGVKGSWCR